MFWEGIGLLKEVKCLPGLIGKNKKVEGVEWPEYTKNNYVDFVIGKSSMLSKKRHDVYANIKYGIPHGFIFLFEPKLK